MSPIKSAIADRVLMAFGLIGGLTSFWSTLEFAWIPEFQATNLDVGPTHSSYHPFREALLALAENLLLITAGITGRSSSREFWAAAMLMVAV